MEEVARIIAKTVMPLIFNYLPFFITVIVAWITISQLYLTKNVKPANEKNEVPVHKERQNKKDTQSVHQQQNQQQSHPKLGKKKQTSGEKWQQGKQSFTHEWLLTSLKGHSGTILDMDFSANGKFLATCADDRAIFVWSTKHWKEREQKYIRYNVEYDHASVLKWSPDSKAFVYNRSTDNQLEVCKIVRKQDGWIASISKASTFPKAHTNDVIGLGISVNGKFLMTCSSGTEIALWDLKGNEIHRFETYLINNYSAKISPCGNFIAASGFVPDVKIWEVCFQKTGEFKQVTSVFQLKGHESSVHDFAFNAYSTQIATISKNGCWRLFNIKVEYNQGEEPKLIKTGNIETDSSNKVSVALSPDGQVIAFALKDDLTLVNAITGKTDKIIKHIYTGGIQKVAFDSGGDFVLTCGERHVRIFHNVTGRRAAIIVAKEKLAQSGNSSATKERLEGIISTSEKFLASFSESM